MSRHCLILSIHHKAKYFPTNHDITTRSCPIRLKGSNLIKYELNSRGSLGCLLPPHAVPAREEGKEIPANPNKSEKSLSLLHKCVEGETNKLLTQQIIWIIFLLPFSSGVLLPFAPATVHQVKKGQNNSYLLFPGGFLLLRSLKPSVDLIK